MITPVQARRRNIIPSKLKRDKIVSRTYVRTQASQPYIIVILEEGKPPKWEKQLQLLFRNIAAKKPDEDQVARFERISAAYLKTIESSGFAGLEKNSKEKVTIYSVPHTLLTSFLQTHPVKF